MYSDDRADGTATSAVGLWHTIDLEEADDVEQGHSLFSRVRQILTDKLGDRIGDYLFPPPVFVAMEGEFLDLDLDAGSLTARFPVLEQSLNPYGTMQGGMVAAAVDNTLGPLSVLLAPPNVTRRLEMTYSRPATSDMGYIVVRARLVERREPWLLFQAEVRSPQGLRLARAQAVHWILGDQTTQANGAGSSAPDRGEGQGIPDSRSPR